jgi:hypothetical protein
MEIWFDVQKFGVAGRWNEAREWPLV